MKTSVYLAVAFLLIADLSVSTIFAQTAVNKMCTDNKLILESNNAMKKLTKQSDNALRARFFTEINTAIYKKVQTIIDDSIAYIPTDLKGKVTIIFSISPEKKVEILNIYGNNPTLTSVVKEYLKKQPIVVSRAMEGKYAIPVVF